MKHVWKKETKGSQVRYLIPEKATSKYVNYDMNDPAKALNELEQQENVKWLSLQDRVVEVGYKDKAYEGEELPAGAYRYVNSMRDDEYLEVVSLRDDKFADANESHKLLMQDIEAFVSAKDVYESIPIIHKLGILCFGGQGEGKSSSIRQALNTTCSSHVSIFLNAIPSGSFLQQLRTSLDGRIKIFILEEITELTKGRGIEPLLSFTDGEQSLNNSIIIATTNYPDQLPANIVDRRSRFDKFYEFGSPKAAQRAKLIEFYLKREASEEEIKKSDGLSTASLKEACIRGLVDGVSLLESFSKLKAHTELVNKSFQKSRRSGIGFSDEDEE